MSMLIYYETIFYICLLTTIAVTYVAVGGVEGAKALVFEVSETGSYSKVAKEGINIRDVELSTKTTEKGNDVKFSRFSRLRKLQLKYLAIYGFMVAGDWLQGPYVYVLYESYGWDREIIGVLFVTGFGSSMIIGTFVGSLADQYGRKRFSLVYVALYIISCLTKHNRNFWMLSIGRLTGGAATSLLMSVFETWLVCEYHHIEETSIGVKTNSKVGSLQQTLSLASLLNFVVAVLSGILAEGVVNIFPYNKDPQSSSSTWFYGGYTAPFDLAVMCLGVGGLMISVLWSENYGNGSQTSSGFFAVLKQVSSSKLILCLGLTQACCEGAMYSFIFLWTPALRQKKVDGQEPLPLGKIFSTFMVCSMLGSQVFSICVKNGISEERIMFMTLLIATFSLVLGPIDDVVGTSLMYLGFLMFEVCIGLYYPAMGTLKSKYVPDQNRSTIYNIFRIPLNAIVLIVLLGNFSIQLSWLLCTLLLFISLILHTVVINMIPTGKTDGISTVARHER
mmetsp:Transcript_2194/g.3103  ORF Transcript_2194/g.3103 Transcript_2194/m.3103 type:complete len:505 (-) Transcript_2194:209-1723(-)